MIYSRLKLSRNLLNDEGVIFCSIDDYEYDNFKKTLDEIYGESNFICSFIWQKNYSPKNNNKFVSEDHEYILLYAKNKLLLGDLNRLPRNEKSNSMYRYDDNDGKGLYRLGDLTIGGSKGYDIKWNGKIFKEPKTRGWAFNEDKMYQLIREGRIHLPEDDSKRPSYKRYLSEVPGLISKTILSYDLVGHTDSSKKSLDSLLGINIFSYPKPMDLIKHFLTLATDKGSLILDFFSGSSTTAHAVLEKNIEDNGNRKFIMVQLPEVTDEKSEAYKAGYKNICEIGKERIRRAGRKIIEENKDKEGIENLDIGFRVLKCDSSNMKDVYYNPQDIQQTMLDDMSENIKEDRTSEDLLFQVMLDLGVELSAKIEEKEVQGKKVFYVDDNYLVATFDKDINDEIITEIAKQKPYYFVMRDSSLSGDSVSSNFDQIFNTYSPETIRRVL